MRVAAIVILVVAALGAGCATTTSATVAPGAPYTTPAASRRSPLTAERLTMEAADLVETDPGEAERLLREALTADLYHGPAHNNLGVLFLEQGKLYEAANEFEWARKLMPGHPDPRLNLALTLERAGRIDAALASFDAALEVCPEHLPTVQALTRCQIRYGRTDERTTGMLEMVALRSHADEWREWSRRQLLRRE